LVAQQLAAGVDGVVVHGLASEAYKLDDAERDRVLAVVVEAVAGSVPVIAGCDHSGTEPAVARAARATEIGAHTVMALPPSFVKPTRAELHDYYVRIAEAAAAPLIIQDAPAWTGVGLSTDAVAAIAEACEVPIAVKVEGPPTAPLVRQLQALAIPSIGGHGALHLAEELDAGISGFMPGCALPHLYVGIWRAHRAGDVADAFEMYAGALPLLAFQMASLDAFVAVQKTLLYDSGVIASPTTRCPGTGLDPGQIRWLRLLLERSPIGLSDRLARQISVG
jgi:4-hydroxy-tetrahydrodipicolinate synthase